MCRMRSELATRQNNIHIDHHKRKKLPFGRVYCNVKATFIFNLVEKARKVTFAPRKSLIYCASQTLILIIFN
jgi:hypothetical protein